MKLSISIDVPNLQQGIDFYCAALDFKEYNRPVEGYVILKNGELEIGLLAKDAGTRPAKNCDDLRRYDRHWTPVHADFYVDNFDQVLSSALKAGAICEQKFEGGKHPPVAFCSDPFGNGFCLIGNRK